MSQSTSAVVISVRNFALYCLATELSVRAALSPLRQLIVCSDYQFVHSVSSIFGLLIANHVQVQIVDV